MCQNSESEKNEYKSLRQIIGGTYFLISLGSCQDRLAQAQLLPQPTTEELGRVEKGEREGEITTDHLYARKK